MSVWTHQQASGELRGGAKTGGDEQFDGVSEDSQRRKGNELVNGGERTAGAEGRRREQGG